MSIMNLLISFADEHDVERLLYGEPDPWLRLFECRTTGGNQPNGNGSGNGNGNGSSNHNGNGQHDAKGPENGKKENAGDGGASDDAQQLPSDPNDGSPAAPVPDPADDAPTPEAPEPAPDPAADPDPVAPDQSEVAGDGAADPDAAPDLGEGTAGSAETPPPFSTSLRSTAQRAHARQPETAAQTAGHPRPDDPPPYSVGDEYGGGVIWRVDWDAQLNRWSIYYGTHGERTEHTAPYIGAYPPPPSSPPEGETDGRWRSVYDSNGDRVWAWFRGAFYEYLYIPGPADPSAPDPQETQESQQEAREAAEQARQRAREAREKAEQAREAAEQARDEAERERLRAEAERLAAEADRLAEVASQVERTAAETEQAQTASEVGDDYDELADAEKLQRLNERLAQLGANATANQYATLASLYRQLIDAFDADARTQDGRSLAEALAQQADHLDDQAALIRTNAEIAEITAQADEGDTAALEAIASDPERANLPVTIYATDEDGERIPATNEDGTPRVDADGNPVYQTETVTMADYIREHLIPDATERAAVHDANAEIGDILKEVDEGDVAALEAIASDPDRANLPVTVYATDEDGERIPATNEDGTPKVDADGNPVYQTETVTMAQYIRDHVIPQAQERSVVDATHAEVNAILAEVDEGDVAALEAIASDPDRADIPVTIYSTDENGERVPATNEDGTPKLDADGNPVYQTRTVTMAQYIREHVIPQAEERGAVHATNTEINDILAEVDKGDIAALEAIASDPDRANLPVTVYATDENGEPIPQLGPDGEPVLDANGNPVYETRTVTMAEYIRKEVVPSLEFRQQVDDAFANLDVEQLQQLADSEHARGSRITVNATDPDGNPIPRVDEDGEPVTDADGNPVFETRSVTWAEYLQEYIPQIAEHRADAARSLGLPEDATGAEVVAALAARNDLLNQIETAAAAGDTEALAALAENPDAQRLMVRLQGSDQSITVADYVNEYRIPNVQGRIGQAEALGLPPTATAEEITRAHVSVNWLNLPPTATEEEQVAKAQANIDAAREAYERAREVLRNTTQDDSDGNTTHEYNVASTAMAIARQALELAEARLEDVERGDGQDTVHRRTKIEHEEYWGSDDDVSGGGASGGGGGDPADQRSYTVAPDGTVSYTDGHGRTYTVSDDDLADDVRAAAETGDASNLTGTNAAVTVADDQGSVVAANFELPSPDDGASPLSQPTVPPLTQAIANAVVSGEVASVDVAGATVSTDSNGYVTVRNDQVSVTYRPDGSVLATQQADGEGGYRSADGDGASRVAQDAGLLMSPDQLHFAAAVATIDPAAPTQTDPNALNYGYLLDAEVAWFRDQLNGLPDDPAAAAARLEELADVARENAQKWDNTDLGGLNFTGADGRALTLGEYYRGEAERYGDTATDIRQNLQANADFAADVERANAALTVEEQASDPLEVDRRQFAPLQEHAGNLGYTAAQYEQLARQWASRPDNERVRIPVHGETDDGYGLLGYTTPAEWFAEQAEQLRSQEGQTQTQFDDAVARKEALEAAAAELRADIKSAEAALTYTPQASDDDTETTSRSAFAGYDDAEGNLNYTRDQYLKLAQEWESKPENAVLQVPMGHRSVSPSEYFRIQAGATGAQATQMADAREQAKDQMLREMAIKDRAAPGVAFDLPGGGSTAEPLEYAYTRQADVAMDTPDGSSTERVEITLDEYAAQLREAREYERAQPEQYGVGEDYYQLGLQNLEHPTWDGQPVRFVDENLRPVDSEDQAAFRVGFDDNRRPVLQKPLRDSSGAIVEWQSTGSNPENKLGLSDQSVQLQQAVDRAGGYTVDKNGNVLLPDSQQVEGLTLGDVDPRVRAGGNNRRAKDIASRSFQQAIPPQYIAGVNRDGSLKLKPGWEDHVVPLHPDHQTITSVDARGNPNVDRSGFSQVAPWLSIVPGASTALTAYDVTHPGSAAGTALTGQEKRDLGKDAFLDSVYIFGFPYGGINLARGVGASVRSGVASGGLRGGVTKFPGAIGTAAKRLPRAMLWDASLPRVTRVVAGQHRTGAGNLARGPISTFRQSPGSVYRGIRNEMGEEFIVEYPLEVAAPHIFKSSDRQPVWSSDRTFQQNLTPGSSGLIPDWGNTAFMLGSAGYFGTVEGIGGRRFGRGRLNSGDAPALPTPEASAGQGPRAAGMRRYYAELRADGIDHNTAMTMVRARTPVAGGIHPISYQRGPIVGGRSDTPWPAHSFDTRIVPTPTPVPHGYSLTPSGLLTPTPTQTTTPTADPTPAGEPTPTGDPTPDPTPTPTSGRPDPTATPTPMPSRPIPTPTPTPGRPSPTPTATATPGRPAPTPTATPGRPTLTPTPTATPGRPTPTPTPTPGRSAPTPTPTPGRSRPDPTPTPPFTSAPTPTAPPDPNVPEPGTPDPPTPDPNTPEPNTPEPNVPDPKVPEPDIPEPDIPEPDIPEPEIPEPQTPTPTPPPPTGGRDEPTPPPRKPDPTPTPTPTRRGGGSDNVRRSEIANPVADDPNAHPREIEFVEPVRHTVDLITGEHTIEPLDDQQVRSARIKSFSPQNPEGQVHLAGSVQLEVDQDHITLESTDRRKDAGDPVDYRKINFVDRSQGQPGTVDYSKLQMPGAGEEPDYRNINPVQQESSGGGVDYSKLEMPKANGQTDYREINPVEQQPSGTGVDYSKLEMPAEPASDFGSPSEKRDARGAGVAAQSLKRPETRAELETFHAKYRRGLKREPTGDLDRDLATYREALEARAAAKSSASGSKRVDYSKINPVAGQGPAAPKNRRSANNIDPGMLGGGAAMRRRGGGKRRKDAEDEDEKKYRRPVVQVVLND